MDPIPTNAGPPAWLSEIAAWVAAADGDNQPSSAQYVETTRRAAARIVSGSWVDSDQDVYLVMLRGNFVHNRHPYGVPPPRGTVATFTADRITQGIYDFSLGDRVPDLSALGQIHDLPLPEAPELRP